MDPTAETLLHQRGRTITRDYKVSIWNNIQLLVLEDYYQKRFGWINTEYGKLIGGSSHQCTDENRTNIGNESTRSVCENYQ